MDINKNLDLEEIREKIDRLDSQLVKLLEERLHIVQEVAQFKKLTGKKIFDEKREKEVIQKNLERVENKELNHYIELILKDIMDSSKEYQKFKIGISTRYVNDLELENKTDCSPHNAFFACFSSRVNDLNQFRLYGKEDGVEASGCCLVFNKDGNWLKEPDILAPFRSFIKNQGENSAEFKEADIPNVECENLPLYQVAYIAYKDEYIAKEKCEIWLDNFKFGICLKSIDKNGRWYKFRIKKLKEALQQLMDFFKKKANVNDKNKNALEYIRYLFKDFAFRDEEEFRVLKMAEIGSEEIEYCKTTKSIYLPYADISNVVDEVILGTNYEKTNSRHKAEVFQHQMKQKCPYVKVSRSSLPIYANPPIKKD